jgi:hypothetical protein
MNREIISAGQFFLVVLGLMAWVAAALFGAIPTTVDAEVAAGGGTAHVKTTNPAGAGAACGFAVAGGLCFLGAALASRPGGGKPDAEQAAQAASRSADDNDKEKMASVHISDPRHPK